MAENDVKDRWYDFATFYYKDQEINMNGIKISYKAKETRHYGINSPYPYRTSLGEAEISWDASEIDDRYFSILQKAAQEHLLGKSKDDYIALYNLDENMEPVERYVLYNAWIASWDDEDAGTKNGAKGGANRMKDLE